jgi:hypothetical protein
MAAGDGMASTLIVQLQTWRAAWLLQLCVPISLVLVLVRLRRQGSNRGPIAALLLIAYLQPAVPLSGLAGSAAALLALLLLHLQLSGRLPPIGLVLRATLYTAAGLFAALQISLEVYAGFLRATLPEPLDSPGPAQFLGGEVGRLIMLAAFSLLALRRAAGTERKAWPAAPAVLSALLILSACLAWDQRSDWQRMLEARASPPPFARTLPAGAQIFWPPDPVGAWLILGRPSYVSNPQGAGALFGRGTALEYRRRMDALGPLLGGEGHGFAGSRLESCARMSRPPLPSALLQACAAAPGLDFLVLPWPIGGLETASWRAPTADIARCKADGAVAGMAFRDFHLFDCREVRNQARRAAAATPGL